MFNLEATRNVWELLDSNADFSEFATLCLHRFTNNDFGDISEKDSIVDDERIIGCYHIPEWIEEVYEDCLWIIMSEDRSSVMLTFAGDY